MCVCFGARWAGLAGVTGLRDCFKSNCSFQMDAGSLFSAAEAAKRRRGGRGVDYKLNVTPALIQALLDI